VRACTKDDNDDKELIDDAILECERSTRCVSLPHGEIEI